MSKNKKRYSQIINRFRTPSPLVNVTNAGGIKMGTICEVWGPYKAGKTTFCLQTGEYLLQDYKEDARLVLISAEASDDMPRYENTFNIHPGNPEIETLEKDSRVSLHYIPTIEDAFNTAIKFVEESTKNNTPTLIIIDSIAALKPKADYDELQKSLSDDSKENKYSQGMMLAARITSAKLTDLLARMPNSNAVVFLINQITADLDSYIKKDKPKGGNAKNHAIHMSLKFANKASKAVTAATDTDTKSFVSTQAGDDKHIRKTTYTNLTIEKNKFSISEEAIELCINNVDLGGKFIELYELMKLSISKGILAQVGGYYQLNDYLRTLYPTQTVIIKNDKPKALTEKFRFADIAKSPEFISILKYELTEYYRTKVSTVDNLYSYMEKFAEKHDYQLPEFWRNKRETKKNLDLTVSDKEIEVSLAE